LPARVHRPDPWRAHAAHDEVEGVGTVDGGRLLVISNDSDDREYLAVTRRDAARAPGPSAATATIYVP
jgi:hypothetical protein